MRVIAGIVLLGLVLSVDGEDGLEVARDVGLASGVRRISLGHTWAWSRLIDLTEQNEY